MSKEQPDNDNEYSTTRQSVREQLEKSQKDVVAVRGVTLEQAADFYRGKQAGDSEKADGGQNNGHT
jgi:hypothetical protein